MIKALILGVVTKAETQMVSTGPPCQEVACVEGSAVRLKPLPVAHRSLWEQGSGRSWV